MPKIIPTQSAQRLVVALKKRGLDVLTEHWDGHKHVDIFIPMAKLNIEVDGIQHFIMPSQILSDFKREYYSTHDGFYTMHIPNILIQTNLNKIADAIAELVRTQITKS